MSGHDPAPLIVPPLRRKERMPEEREGSAMWARGIRKYQRRKKKKITLWSAASHAVKHTMQPMLRRSLGCRSPDAGAFHKEIATINRK